MTKDEWNIAVIGKVIKDSEGGFVNDPDDRGGATNYGITMQTLKEWRGGGTVTEHDVKDLSIDEARNIYYYLYVKRYKLDELPDELAEIVFDSVINHGPRGGIRILQRAVGAKDDGVIGQETVEKAKINIDKVYLRVIGERLKYYASIIKNQPSQVKFMAGWINRVLRFLDK